MASSVPSVQKRSRTTAEQLSRMVDFLAEKPGLAGSRFQKLHGKSDCDKKWSELASMLNSLGGLVKNVDQWCTVWSDLKSRTSIKVRDRKRKQAMTGNNPINEDPPTELERRVIALVGSDYVQGNETVAESVPVQEELQLRIEEGDESVIIEMPSISHEVSIEMCTSTPVTPAGKTPRRGAKRRRVDGGTEAQKTFLEIAQTQANALKMLAESSAANVQIAGRQTDALKLLAKQKRRVCR
ncbi:PREDICTED: uncharacterized protein LOC108366628 [Rhagoletis zephyria]|uniref:uncharacterized protein LOC108366628 n=1 Tax=Rhagoletis zephyria TaxID=28612 RepID=UPI0008119013|nr:PREDICTED: uncharacterized protein LOC108366628 [Rhagoletis zephyria]XP_017476569.1 PREDICTED: uncharacterized protein LOC108366628 [Rhagoletis zephyria]XP_017476570.1 PREDICTED: uncharacterized protein LOC108366628 [Rhagoletis zephyria]